MSATRRDVLAALAADHERLRAAGRGFLAMRTAARVAGHLVEVDVSPRADFGGTLKGGRSVVVAAAVPGAWPSGVGTVDARDLALPCRVELDHTEDLGGLALVATVHDGATWVFPWHGLRQVPGPVGLGGVTAAVFRVPDGQNYIDFAVGKQW